MNKGEPLTPDGVNIDADSADGSSSAPCSDAPPIFSQDEQQPCGKSQNFAAELIFVWLKTVAVTVAVAVAVVAILAIAMPLQAMRTYNKLGMSDRAVDFAERYIARELKKYDAFSTDAAGNYVKLSRTPQLTNPDFTEALYVCIRTSHKLAESSYAVGDKELGEYYAERLEKYTRMYISLSGVTALADDVSQRNIAAVPRAVQPMVYSYLHEIHSLNYRARTYLGSTDYITHERLTEGAISPIKRRADKFYGTQLDNSVGLMQLLDEFAVYIGQINEYLDVEFIKAGVINDTSARVNVKIGDRYYSDLPITSELAIPALYSNVFSGNEFSLFVLGLDGITETSHGFTDTFNKLSCFTRYAQAAVDFVPRNRDEQLRRLYWLSVLSSASSRLMYMETLLYYNQAKFGASGKDIVADYGREGGSTCARYEVVTYAGSPKYELVKVYSDALNDYIKSPMR